MIPKIIHYCWFGGNPLPKSAQKCIASWRKFFPDYEIKEWNESNFDVNSIPYTTQAYSMKKYAFVSDYARFHILYHHGGIYFDTDVEVIRSLDDILAKGGYLGMEAPVTDTQERLFVSPGLGMACEAGDLLWKKIVEHYHSLSEFSLASQGTVCVIVTDLLERLGVTMKDEIFTVENTTIYPSEFFCPQAKMGAPIHLTENTRTIHHFDCTWLPAHVRFRSRLVSRLPKNIARFIRKLKRK